MIHAAVVGAGIGGLSAAIGLRQAGLKVSVFERSPVFSPVGAGIVLWSNAVKALRELGVDDDRLEGAHIKRGVISDRQGRELSSTPAAEVELLLGAPTIALHRAGLHRALLSALPEETVRLGKTFEGFSSNGKGVTVRFADGAAEHFDLLVGADGIHSAVRRQLFPDVRERYAGYVAWRGVVTAGSSLAQGETAELWGRGSRFGIVPIGLGQVYWFATTNQPEGFRRDPLARKVYLMKTFRGWHPVVEELIAATEETRILENDVIDFAPMQHWGEGPVTLLGDAAHATTPNLGQGACQAVESSLALVGCLKEVSGGAVSIIEALRRYEDSRRERTAWITNQSRRIGKIGQLENGLLCALRDTAMRLTPQSVMRKQLKKMVGIS